MTICKKCLYGKLCKAYKEECEYCNQFKLCGYVADNGVEIFEGDKVKGLWWINEPIVATCKYDEKTASFGLEWKRGNVTEFNPFCTMCNTEYEVTE